MRQTGNYGIVGTSKGYYITDEVEDIEKAIQSQQMRIRQQQRAVDGMIKYLNKIKKS